MIAELNKNEYYNPENTEDIQLGEQMPLEGILPKTTGRLSELRRHPQDYS